MAQTAERITISRAQLERIKDRLTLARKHDEASTSAVNEAAAVFGPLPPSIDVEVVDVLVEWSIHGASVDDSQSESLEALARLGITLAD